MKWKRGEGGNKDVVDIRGTKRRGGDAGGGGGLGGRSGGIPIPGGIAGLGGGAGVVVIIALVLISALGDSRGSGFGIPEAFGTQASVPGAANPAPIPAPRIPTPT